MDQEESFDCRLWDSHGQMDYLQVVKLPVGLGQHVDHDYELIPSNSCQVLPIIHPNLIVRSSCLLLSTINRLLSDHH